MGIKISKHTGILLLGCSLAIAPLLLNAQQTESDDSVAAAPDGDLGDVQYIDVPMAIDPDSDFELPPARQAPDPEQDPLFQQRLDNIRNYDLSVQQIEVRDGAWSKELTEELNALGLLQQQQGDHISAVETFNRAIHINRINSGLHTLEQVPLIEHMIDSFLALGDLEQADIYNSYLLYISLKSYGRDDPRMIPVLERMADWNIQLYHVRYGESLSSRLVTAQTMYNVAARLVSLHFGSGDDRFINYLRGIANAAFLVAGNPDLAREIDRNDFRSTEQVLRDGLADGQFKKPAAFVAAEDVLIAIAEYYAAKPGKEREQVMALADLGDWYLIFGTRRESEAKYLEAWQLAASLENGEELLQQVFGQVIPIPTFIHDRPGNHLLEKNVSTVGGALSYDYVDLVLDVTENGTVRNVRPAHNDGRTSEKQLDGVSRLVRQTYFRPLVINGERVRSTDHYFRYRYWY